MDNAIEKYRKRRQKRLDAKSGVQEAEYDSVAEFRKRRDARLKKRLDEEEWVTIRGTHVMVDDNGQVSKGPKALKDVVKKSGGYKPKAKSEEMSFKSGGKTWDKESLTKLWQGRGYSKKQAEARAEKDLKETRSAIKKNTESGSEDLTAKAGTVTSSKAPKIKKSSSENDRKKQECDGTGYNGEPGVVKTGAKGNLAPKSETSKKVDTADALGEVELYKKTNGQRGLPRNSMSDFIDENGNLSPERQKVHDEIIQKLFADKVPYDGQATMTMSGGGPASGKSFVSDNAKKKFGDDTVMVVDPDGIKAMLPGYADMAVAGDKAAGFYHEESSALAKRIYQYALDNNINVVYDGTGDGSINSVQKKIQTARDAGYKVKGEYVTVDVDGEDGALVRNRNRYEHGKRDWEAGRQDIDPPRLVGDDHVAEIHQKVSDIIPQVAGMFDEFTLIDNNVPKGAPKHLIATCKRGGEIQVVKGMEDKMQKCMDKGNRGWKVKDGKIIAP